MTKGTSSVSSRGMSQSRRSDKPHLTTIYWRDIPAQVTARAGRTKASGQLDARFQAAIDGAATRAGKTNTDDYLAQWREERADCTRDLEGEVAHRIAELEARFPPTILQQYVKTGGWAP